MELIFQYISKRLCLMQSSIADYTGQFLQHYETIKMIHMQYEYGICKIWPEQRDGEQTYLWDTLCWILDWTKRDRDEIAGKVLLCKPEAHVHTARSNVCKRQQCAKVLIRAIPSAKLCCSPTENTQECRSCSLPAPPACLRPMLKP